MLDSVNAVAARDGGDGATRGSSPEVGAEGWGSGAGGAGSGTGFGVGSGAADSVGCVGCGGAKDGEGVVPGDTAPGRDGAAVVVSGAAATDGAAGASAGGTRAAKAPAATMPLAVTVAVIAVNDARGTRRGARRGLGTVL